MRFLVFFSMLIFGLSHSQDSIILDKKLNEAIQFLDKAMQENDNNIVDVLDQNVTFGHSNGWIQNYNDFLKDIKSNKVKYQSVNQTELKEYKKYKNTVSVRRVVSVKGIYKKYDFQMQLSLLEIWIKNNKQWKLWSRQSIELKP